MSRINQAISQRKIAGWVMVILGLPVLILSLLLQFNNTSSPYNFRILGGAGIVLLGLGIGALLSARGLSKDPVSGARQIAETDDERAQLIRGKAASAGFIVMSVLVYLLLLWQSFAGAGMLPNLSADQMWVALAVCVVAPMVVYFVSYAINQKKY
ncbi:MAG TPA: hypothetical protein PKD55_04495 [Bellilinea sp.]|mgnify:CR=1 FL=1|nr:hypothetical protein [Bellilinea sp.]